MQDFLVSCSVGYLDKTPIIGKNSHATDKAYEMRLITAVST